MGDGGAIAMCSVMITMDSGGGNGRWRRDGNAMGDDDGGGAIAMGNGGGGAMDCRMTAQS